MQTDTSQETSTDHRDVKSASYIEAEGMKRVPMDYREFKPGEI
jgi:hypothetical protein